MDDMLLKSVTNDDHIANLDKVFTKLLAHRMRLNPQKCILVVGGGKFQGFMVSERGIEANPEKIQAILDMTVPSTRNEVQCLTGRLVALARFISRLTDKCNPLFQLLKSQYKENVTWGLEHDDAFNNIKAYLAAVPLLSKPVPGEVLYLNLVVSATAISAALTRHEHDNELPIYYCGRGFADPETRYLDIEKLALALITTTRQGYTGEDLPKHTRSARIGGRRREIFWQNSSLHIRASSRDDLLWEALETQSPTQKVAEDDGGQTETEAAGYASRTAAIGAEDRWRKEKVQGRGERESSRERK
ncbi:hypothetical protein ACLB2K_012464 [Fragaria x ananassa]